jgi:hypothetical protein
MVKKFKRSGRIKKINIFFIFVLISLLCTSLCGIVSADDKQVGAKDTRDLELAKDGDQESKDITFFGKKIIPIINLDLLGTYSKIQGHNDTGGAIVDVLVSPAIKINDDHYVIPLYNFNYTREQQIISEEEGGYSVQQTMNHNVYLTNKLKLNDNLTSKISGFGTWAYYKETKDEDWSDGLYDYTDVGGILDFEYELGDLQDPVFNELGLELEYYRRQYPNFQSLISLATPTAPEEDEKDYDGYKLIFGYLRENPQGLSLEATYQPLWKRYTDKLVVGSDGVLIDGDKRKDNQHTFDLNFRYPATKRFTLYLDNELILNRSNQNFYDSKDTIVLSDDEFIDDYYEYTSYMIRPKVSYDIAVKEDKDLTVHLAYAFLDKEYSDRKAQSSSGAYTTEDEEDKFHTFSFGLSYPLTDKVKAIALFDYTIAKSNMEYEKYYRYNYDLMSIACGISCRF